uniref:Uncharacterized protein n=1 Tax=Arundo donax TaxID=35708 RepID=A0A0A9D4N2_ARUDO
MKNGTKVHIHAFTVSQLINILVYVELLIVRSLVLGTLAIHIPFFSLVSFRIRFAKTAYTVR